MTGLLGLDKTTIDDLSLIGMSPEQLQTHFTHARKLLQHICPVGGEREMHISCRKKGKVWLIQIRVLECQNLDRITMKNEKCFGYHEDEFYDISLVSRPPQYPFKHF